MHAFFTTYTRGGHVFNWFNWKTIRRWSERPFIAQLHSQSLCATCSWPSVGWSGCRWPHIYPLFRRRNDSRWSFNDYLQDMASRWKWLVGSYRFLTTLWWNHFCHESSMYRKSVIILSTDFDPRPSTEPHIMEITPKAAKKITRLKIS